MSLAIIHSRAAQGVDAPAVQVEVHVAGGLPGMTLVGLPATAVKEAKDRVRAALQNNGYSLPPRRITVNLAPADLPKDGARFDLAIAIGILSASGQLGPVPEDLEFLGELSLSGELRSISAVLPAVITASKLNRRLFIPRANASEAALASFANAFQASNLLQVCSALQMQSEWDRVVPLKLSPQAPKNLGDFADVRGQKQAKRALEIAACGRHNVLFMGPPGSGKSMLAQRLPSIMPLLTESQALELSSIHSAAHMPFTPETWRLPPFRNPHHSVSAAALSGGGGIPRPGEISLAHHGVLFLDELPEFRRDALETLREPMETGEARISRVRAQITYPSRFQLLATMNPCPCGYLGDSSGRCHCSAEQVLRYRQRVSGPLLDRIDMHVTVPRLTADEMLGASQGDDSSQHIRQRVLAAREQQERRDYGCNAELGPAELSEVCALDTQAQRLLQQAAEHMQLSGRALHRVMKVARTIADLDQTEAVQATHLAEALQYRTNTGYLPTKTPALGRR